MSEKDVSTPFHN